MAPENRWLLQVDGKRALLTFAGHITVDLPSGYSARNALRERREGM
jgi:hypothetical protein